MAAPGLVQKAPVAAQVDYSCGRGFHLTPWGVCRPNGWRRSPPPYWGHRPPPPPYGLHSGYRPHRGHRPPPGWY
ncbi:GCG_CRPN prefix-to-repeats domain-containing protein [Rhizobium leguminosarum]|uniref:GCG_CRPN prefix-to-repeats domain-containing protein n=1 Tax=Rhizobium leguminosarum TaxID=384 RepID=UPI00391878DD